MQNLGGFYQRQSQMTTQPPAGVRQIHDDFQNFERLMLSIKNPFNVESELTKYWFFVDLKHQCFINYDSMLMNEQFFVDFILSQWLNIDILMVFHWQISYFLMMLKMVDILLIKDWLRIDFLLIFDKSVDFSFIFC